MIRKYSAILMLILIMLLSACESSYKQVVITPAAVVDGEMSEDNQSIAYKIDQEETAKPTPKEETPEEPPVTTEPVVGSPTVVVEEVNARGNSEQENIDRERKAYLLVDLSSITAQNCESEQDLWQKLLNDVEEQLDNANGDLDDARDDLESSQKNYDAIKNSGTSGQKSAAQDRIDSDEKNVRKFEEKVADYEEKKFRTEYTYNEVKKKCKQYAVTNQQ